MFRSTRGIFDGAAMSGILRRSSRCGKHQDFGIFQETNGQGMA